jgi:tetratricopeptide (TPR) repeat protein
MQMGGSQNEPVDRVAFLNAVFNKTKPPIDISRILLSPGGSMPVDSTKKTLKWAEETQNHALVAVINYDLFALFRQGKETEIARQLIFTAAEYSDNQKISGFLFQQGKILIDKGLAQNSKNMELRNALIIYQSEYLNQPMQFLATLKESLLIDSNNIELNFIHLNLLKKSQQWEKAIKKCQKLVSLQPQNPYWLFETSDIFGNLGDSTNAKIYLNLAVKSQKNQK